MSDREGERDGDGRGEGGTKGGKSSRKEDARSDATPTGEAIERSGGSLAFMARDFETFKRQFDADPFHRMLGISVLEQRPGYGRIQLEIGPDTPGGIGGSVHGGVLATLVDVSMLVAIFGGLRPGQMPAGTADLGITYMRQAHGERIEAEAKVVKHGRQLAVVEVDITDAAGQLCARGRVLYAFRPMG